MESNRKWNIGRLIAVAVLAGGAGVVWELPSAAAGGPPTGVSEVVAIDMFGSGAFALIDDNGSGTAFTAIFTYISPEVFLGTLVFENPNFSSSSHVDPGQSGRGSGSGAGQFTIDDAWAFNIFTFEPVGPFDVSVELGVDGATNTGAYINQGMNSQLDPFSGEARIVRTNIRGNQAWGDTCGSLSVFVDDGNGLPGLVADATGTYGQVGNYTTHTVERIR